MVVLNPSARVDGKVEPAVDAEPITLGQPFVKGIARAIWVGSAGTGNLITANDTLLTDFPLKEGILPMQVKAILTGGTATDLWALF